MARKYIWVQAFKLSKLNEEENDNFQFSSPLHFTGNEEVFIQHTKNSKFKNRKENWYRGEGEVKATFPIGENDGSLLRSRY